MLLEHPAEQLIISKSVPFQDRMNGIFGIDQIFVNKRKSVFMKHLDAKHISIKKIICGRFTNMKQEQFVEDKGWNNAAMCYEQFLQRHRNLKIVFLELGVGYNTPVIIKYPFWQMTAKNPKATYICINAGEAFCPEEIERQAICIDDDIDRIFHRLKSL